MTALYSPTELDGLTEAALLLLLYSDLTRSLHSRWPQVRASTLCTVGPPAWRRLARPSALLPDATGQGICRSG